MPYGFQQAISGMGSATIIGGSYTVAIINVTVEGGKTEELDANLIPRITRVGYIAICASWDDASVKYVEWWKWIDFAREIVVFNPAIGFADTVEWNLYPGTTVYLQLEYS